MFILEYISIQIISLFNNLEILLFSKENILSAQFNVFFLCDIIIISFSLETSFKKLHY